MKSLPVSIVVALAAFVSAAKAEGLNPPGDICPSILRPVCAENGADSQTFANRCLAERAGFSVVGEGGCEGESAGASALCSKEYLPVCAEKNGVRRSFRNECQARAANFAIVYDDACD